jgi:mRNA-degrading endonuclease RelE of RelBE toxin-antitoxin system
MKGREPFRLIYGPAVIEHTQAIERKYYSLIRATIEDQLLFEPNVETTNRKPLKRPPIVGGQWELRFGPNNRFRVFYEIDEGAREVHILAIGVKERDQLYIAGREVEL